MPAVTKIEHLLFLSWLYVMEGGPKPYVSVPGDVASLAGMPPGRGAYLASHLAETGMLEVVDRISHPVEPQKTRATTSRLTEKRVLAVSEQGREALGGALQLMVPALVHVSGHPKVLSLGDPLPESPRRRSRESLLSTVDSFRIGAALLDDSGPKRLFELAEGFRVFDSQLRKVLSSMIDDGSVNERDGCLSLSADLLFELRDFTHGWRRLLFQAADERRVDFDRPLLRPSWRQVVAARDLTTGRQHSTVSIRRFLVAAAVRAHDEMPIDVLAQEVGVKSSVVVHDLKSLQDMGLLTGGSKSENMDDPAAPDIDSLTLAFSNALKFAQRSSPMMSDQMTYVDHLSFEVVLVLGAVAAEPGLERRNLPCLLDVLPIHRIDPTLRMAATSGWLRRGGQNGLDLTEEGHLVLTRVAERAGTVVHRAVERIRQSSRSVVDSGMGTVALNEPDVDFQSSPQSDVSDVTVDPFAGFPPPSIGRLTSVPTSRESVGTDPDEEFNRDIDGLSLGMGPPDDLPGDSGLFGSL